MSASRVLVVAAFLLVLALPFLVRPAGSGAPPTPEGADVLIIVTPHVPQIREEFGARFTRWHARRFPQDPPVTVDWRVPGGTSEIVKQLRAEYEAAARAAARDGTLRVLSWGSDGTTCEATIPERSMGADIMFGGGHYEHDQLRAGVTVRVRIGGKEVATLVRISEPAGFDPARLLGSETSWFRENKIGNQELFQEEQYWIGAALSAFGIVYNRELIAERGMKEPRTFADLTDFGYFRALALTDPRQSGSVTTTYESILNKEGWDEGWRILREMSANARGFASSSTKPPMDVSQGEAIAGLAIDFYGRAQAQAILREGQDPASGRVGYVDPPGAVYIDPDPLSVLRGCPNPELARRFIEFCMSDEAQTLWQLPPTSSPAGKNNPIGEDGKPLGPERYALRRLPVRPAVFGAYGSHFVDKVNPFEVAAPLPNRGWRRAIDLMMGAFAVDTLDDLRDAWEALNRVRRAAASSSEAARLAETMTREFHAFPRGEDVRHLASALFPGVEFPPDALLDFSPEITDRQTTNAKGADNCRRITATWSSLDVRSRLRVVYTEYFREQYRKVVEMASQIQ